LVVGVRRRREVGKKKGGWEEEGRLGRRREVGKKKKGRRHTLPPSAVAPPLLMSGAQIDSRLQTHLYSLALAACSPALQA
jgi:hypothetical protein